MRVRRLVAALGVVSVVALLPMQAPAEAGLLKPLGPIVQPVSKLLCPVLDQVLKLVRPIVGPQVDTLLRQLTNALLRCPTPDELIDRLPLSPANKASLRLRVHSTTPVRLLVDQSFPTGVAMSIAVTGADPLSRARNYLARFGDLYRLSRESRLVPSRVEPDLVTFEQTYRGVPVDGASLAIRLVGSTVRGTTGRLVPDDPRVDPRPGIALGNAELIAANSFPAEDGAPLPQVVGASRLVIHDPRMFEPMPPGPPVLAWLVPFQQALLVLDATDGRILMRRAVGQPHTGPLGIDIDVRDGENVYAEWNSECNQKLAVAPDDGEGALLRNRLRAVVDWFHTVFGRHGTDDANGEIVGGVNMRIGNGMYDPACDTVQFASGWVSSDVVAHELTHAVIEKTSNIYYWGSSGSINESFADAMAAAFSGDYRMSEDAPANNGQPIRDMANPPLFNQPDSLEHELYKPTCTFAEQEQDGCFVHTHSGIQNKVFFLLAEGGAHYGTLVNALGRARTRYMAYQAMTHAPDTMNWDLARFQWQLEAELSQNAFPADPNDVCNVGNAWGSVGVGLVDANCDTDIFDETGENSDADGDGVSMKYDNCPGIYDVEQQDTDGDDLGDICDPDLDGDGHVNFDNRDNCPRVFNPDQADGDLDGIGNACDSDIDNDGFAGTSDNCPSSWNPAQGNIDGDGHGDWCDGDRDNDGLPNEDDNCPDVANPGQVDTDGGGIGNACDAYPDNPMLPPDETPLGEGAHDILVGLAEDWVLMPIDACVAGCPGDRLGFGDRIGVSIEEQVTIPGDQFVHVIDERGMRVATFDATSGLRTAEIVVRGHHQYVIALTADLGDTTAPVIPFEVTINRVPG